MNEQPVARIDLPDALRHGAVAAALAALPDARAVGGCVRDALAGVPVQDIDIAAPYPPEDFSARLRAAGLKVFDTGLAHGTVTAVLNRQTVEVTALRRDVVTDGRHAEVAWTTDWREDAARRDFTINAMSLTRNGDLFDYFGGREDLSRGVVRFVGDPATRLREDYLRALRFFRFQTRYGRGAPDAKAVAAIEAVARDPARPLDRLSRERVWMELKRIFSVPDPVPAVRLMEGTGVLAAVLPEASGVGGAVDPSRLERLVQMGAPTDPLLRLTALWWYPPSVDLFAARMRLSRSEAAALSFLSQQSAAPPANAPGNELRVWRAHNSEVGGVVQALRLWLEDATQSNRPLRAALRRQLLEEPEPIFPLRGRDVLDQGIPAGPRVSSLLWQVEGWWLNGGCSADREACLAELRRRVAADVGGAGPGGAPWG